MSMICRGLGGGEFTFDLPLPLHARDQIDRGEMQILSVQGEDGRPKETAPKEEWVVYMERIHNLPGDDTSGESKPEIIAWADELEENWG